MKCILRSTPIDSDWHIDRYCCFRFLVYVASILDSTRIAAFDTENHIHLLHIHNFISINPYGTQFNWNICVMYIFNHLYIYHSVFFSHSLASFAFVLGIFNILLAASIQSSSRCSLMTFLTSPFLEFFISTLFPMLRLVSIFAFIAFFRMPALNTEIHSIDNTSEYN